MPIVFQNSFLDKPQVSGNLYDKLKYILIKYPATRDDYRLAMFHFWREFQGLDRVLGIKAEAFKKWLTEQAVSPKTLQNRVGEIQSQHPELEASPEVERQRRRQATQGPVL